VPLNKVAKASSKKRSNVLTVPVQIRPSTSRNQTALAIALALMFSPASQAADGTWTQLTSGSLWSADINWSGGTIADGSGFSANFNTLDITADTAVSLDSARILGNLIFGDMAIGTAASWALNNNGNAANILTLAGVTPTITVNALGTGKTATISAVIAGTGGLRKAGTGTLVLDGANTYTGTTAVTAGILRLTNASALGGSTTVSTSSGTQLELSGGLTFGTGSTITINGNGTGNSTGALQSASGTNTWAGNIIIGTSDPRIGAQAGATLDVSGVISGTASLRIRNTNNTSGLTILSGANTFDGVMDIFGGNASVSSIGNWVTGNTVATNMGSPTTAARGIISLGVTLNQAALIYTGTGETTNRQIRLNSQTGGITLDQSGSGLLKFSTDFAIPGSGTDNRKTLTLQGSTAGAGEIEGRFGDALSGTVGQRATSLVKSGTGTWILSGANTYTGSTSVTAGILRLANASALGTSATVTMTSGAQLELSGDLTFGTGSTITITGSGAGNFAGSLQSASGTNIWAGNVIIGSSGSRLGAQSGATLNISGVISAPPGSQLVVRNTDQTGTTIFSGNNSYNGPTTVFGRLSVATIGSVGGGNSNLGAPTTAANGQINLGNGANTATLIYTGIGEMTDRVVNVASTDTSGATIDQSGTGLLRFTSAILFDATEASRTLTLQGSTEGTGEIAGVIGDAAAGKITAVTKSGTSTWTLSGANTYSGGTVIKNGSLIIGGGNDRLLTTSTVVLGDSSTMGKLVLGDGTARNQTLAGLSAIGLGGSVVGGAAAPSTLTLNVAGNTTFAGTLGGVGTNENNLAFTKVGSGDLTLSNASNAYSGGTTLSGANNLIMGASGALGNGPLTFTNTSTARLWISGTEQTITGLTILGTGASVIQNEGGGDGILTVNLADGVTSSSTSNFFFRNVAGGTGTLALIKTGAGTLDFSAYAVMSYSGGLTVNGGIFAFNNVAALGTGALTLGGGTLAVTAGASLAISRATTLTDATTSGIDTGGGTVTYSGAITGAGALKKIGDGTLILSNASNNYAGGTNLSAGTLNYGSVAPLGSGDVTFTGTSALQAGVAGTLTNAITINNDVTGTIDTQGNSVTLSGKINGPGTLGKQGAGTLTLSNSTNDYSGGTALSAGTLNYGDLAAVGTGTVTFSGASTLQAGVAGAFTNAIHINNGVTATFDTQANNVTLDGDISGQGQILKKGAGILYLSRANNTFSGGLVVENANTGIVGPTAYGVVLLATNAAGTGPLTIGNASTSVARFSLNGYDQTVSALSSGSGGIRVLEANGITGGAVSTLTVDQSIDTTYTGFLRDQNTGGGKLALVKTGVGLLDLSGAQTASSYSGGLTVNGGTLGFANTQNIGTSGITLGGGTLRYTSVATALTASNLVTLTTATTSSVEVADAGSNLTFSNVISGSGALTKSGVGTLSLNGVNTYSGATVVSAGTLNVGTGAKTGTGSVSIESGASLLGTGVVQGSSFTANSGASIHVGSSTDPSSYGTLTFTPVSGSGSFDFQSGSTVNLGISPGATSDRLNFVGNGSNALLFNGNLTVGPSSFTPTQTEVFDLLDWSGLTGAPTFDSRYSAASYGGLLLGNGDDAFGFDLPDISSGLIYAWDISQFVTNGTIAIVIVPEPSRAVLLMFSLIGLLFLRRR
jgi:autotransporter-associated beta strand protein